MLTSVLNLSFPYLRPPIQFKSSDLSPFEADSWLTAWSLIPLILYLSPTTICLVLQKCHLLQNLQWLPTSCWIFLNLTVKALHNRIITYFSRIFSHCCPCHAWYSSQRGIVAVSWACTVTSCLLFSPCRNALSCPLPPHLRPSQKNWTQSTFHDFFYPDISSLTPQHFTYNLFMVLLTFWLLLIIFSPLKS